MTPDTMTPGAILRVHEQVSGHGTPSQRAVAAAGRHVAARPCVAGSAKRRRNNANPPPIAVASHPPP